jgi:aspartyl-tRNA(Asn)/glutamyl-tRNA(Gln) amidotransferase subunit B
MNPELNKYEVVVGLEVHAQLMTESKAFSSDGTEYQPEGGPNSQVSVISLGHPGTLPRLNEKVVEFAVKLGLAMHCRITEENRFSRKNYFYADLPKGYQITQFDTPICTGGFIHIKVHGAEKRIGITRIHMEEDAGKSLHDVDPYHTLVDLNRAGVPLLEIVSEPDLRSPDEAYEYLNEVRKIVRYLDICDGNMEEGSMRCDANVSVRLKGSSQYNQRTEIKNMNSLRNVKRAIEYEMQRQVEVMETGGTVSMDTRGFDPATGKTFSMRTKEAAHDYRYFTEPDLPPLVVSQDYIEDVRKRMPALPADLHRKYVEEFKLSAYDADVLTEEKHIVLYYEELISHTTNYKAAANWVMGPVKSYLNEHAITADAFPVLPKQLARLMTLVEGNKLSHSAAAQKVFPRLIETPDADPEELAKALHLMQDSDERAIRELVQSALAKFPDKVMEYREGKKGVVGLFMGEMMKLSGGRIDPKLANRLLAEALENA